MVDFTQKPEKANDPSYLGYSGGPIRSNVSADDSQGLFLKGIAVAGDAAVKAGYSAITDSIQKEVWKQTDEIWAEAGVDEAAFKAASGKPPTDAKGNSDPSFFGEDPRPATPPGVTRLGETIGSLREAYEQGRLSNSYYFGRLEAMVRNVRAQYPGFREEVDKIVSSVTGVTPANALRTSLVNDMDRAARVSQSSASEYQRFIVNKAEFLPPDFYTRLKAGKPYQPIDVYEHVARREQEKTNLDVAKSKIALLQANDKYAGENAERTGIQAMDDLANRTIENIYGGLQGPDGIAKMIAQKGDRAWTPDEQKAIRLQINIARQSIDNEAQNILTAPLVPGDTRTLSSVIGDPGKIDAIKKRAHARLNAFEDMLLNDKTGILSMDAVYTKAAQNQALKRILEENQYLLKQSVIANMPGGPELIKLLNMQPDGKPIQSAIKAAQWLDALDLSTTPTSLRSQQIRGTESAKQVPELRGNDGGSHPDLNRARVDNAKTILLNPKSPPAAVLNSARAMFGPDNIGFLELYKPSEQALVYQSLVTPAVHKKMEELKGTNPELYEGYRKWAIEYGFHSQAKAAISEITNIQKNQGATVDIVWSSDLGAFKATPTAATQTALDAISRGDRGADASVSVRYGSEMNAVRKLNRLIDTIQPIMKSEGVDGAVQMLDVLKASGFNPDQKKEAGMVQSAVTWLGEAVKKGYDKYGKWAQENGLRFEEPTSKESK